MLLFGISFLCPTYILKALHTYTHTVVVIWCSLKELNHIFKYGTLEPRQTWIFFRLNFYFFKNDLLIADLLNSAVTF